MDIQVNPTPVEIWRAFQQLGPIVLGKPIEAQTVRTDETTIAHNLGRKPVGWLVYSPTSDVMPTESLPPDSTNLYLIAASEVTVNLWVW